MSQPNLDYTRRDGEEVSPSSEAEGQWGHIQEVVEGSVHSKNIEEDSEKDGDRTILWVTNARSTRMHRLLHCGARFMFNTTRLLLTLYYLSTYEFISDVIITTCLMIWDFVGSMASWTAVPSVAIFFEVSISLGVLTLMCFELSTEKLREPSDEYISRFLEVPFALLWIHFLILSGIIIYQITTDYIQQRRTPRSRPIIVFNELGEPTVVIPRSRSFGDAASLLSIDSLIQVPTTREA
ncbi:hypothetical protein GGR52DRAFT_561867 [Hypoxylon sp. FL1284]|nr:hypothetical protein GGR52DRAFT_561867 [Hypoxylon sp. FL1284]